MVVAAAVGGFIAGIVVAEVIVMVGRLAYDGAAGVRHLPIFTALAAAVAVPVVKRRCDDVPGRRSENFIGDHGLTCGITAAERAGRVNFRSEGRAEVISGTHAWERFHHRSFRT
ncbi:DUF5957 family protein [Thermostaphylospora chromogena]|uniref:DUF5957 family protein n=1 Tax=Thermostaphylospora chromogena TaxID=35622 RepID=UPI0013F617B4|nr:DUF5957 family protein [Thermostaphylospora chromogena]